MYGRLHVWTANKGLEHTWADDMTWIFITQRARYGFLECKYRAISHGSTTDCAAASARGQTTVKSSRINGGKLIP